MPEEVKKVGSRGAPHERPTSWVAWAGTAIAALGWAGAAWSAPITSNTALPVAEGEFVFREQIVVDRSGADPSGAERDRTAWSAISVLGYGINSDLTVFGVVPYVNKHLELTEGDERRAHSAHGLGDVTLFGRYTVFKNNFPGGNFRVAPFVGVEMPTGDDDDSDAFGRKPASVQPGSGSWDPFGGIVLTYQTLDFQIDAQLAYQANTEANGFEFGDVARADASFQYRLWPRELAGGLPGFLYGVVEANLVHAGRNRIDGVEDRNSGGATLFIAPGLQYVTRRWIVETAVQLPVVQNRNGTALESGIALRAGFRFNF